MQGKFVKTARVAKCYENDCLQNFRLHFVSLITAGFLNKSEIKIEIRFFLLKNFLKQT